MSDFSYYAELEPRLLDLERVAESFTGPDGHDAERFWASKIKPLVIDLVGWIRKIPGEPEFEIVNHHEGGFILGDDLLAAAARQRAIRDAMLSRLTFAERDREEELRTPAAYAVVYSHLRIVFEMGIIADSQVPDPGDSE